MLAPGVELAKNTVVLTDPPGAMLPKLCGNGVPLVAPSLAVVNITLLAVVEPMFWTVTLAVTVPAVGRVNDEATTSLTSPHGVVHTAVEVVMLKAQPPAIVPLSPAAKSNTYRLQVPFGFPPLKTDANVADPAGAGSWLGPPGAGAGKTSPAK